MRKTMIAVAGLLCTATPAHAADFLFSFDSTPGASGIESNAVAGTVTGRILGLAETGSSTATQIFIDNLTGSSSSYPVAASSWFNQAANSFTLSGGQITGANFRADNAGFGPFFDQLIINFSFSGVPTNYASVGNINAQAIWNRNGLQGVTFTRINIAVPETATWAMMLLGFGVVGGYMRRKRVGVRYSAA